jgi:hypothetical protein
MAGHNNVMPDHQQPFEVSAQEINRIRLNELLRISEPRNVPVRRRTAAEIPSSASQANRDRDTHHHVELFMPTWAGWITLIQYQLHPFRFSDANKFEKTSCFNFIRKFKTYYSFDRFGSECLLYRQGFLLKVENETGNKFPRLRKKLDVYGISSCEQRAEIALIPVRIDDKLSIERVPFMICELKQCTSILIGANLIKSCNIEMIWSGDDIKLIYHTEDSKGHLRVFYGKENLSCRELLPSHSSTRRNGRIDTGSS